VGDGVFSATLECDVYIMTVENFENEKWQNKEQGISFRLKVALSMIEKGPVLDLGCGDGIFLQLLKEKGIAGEGLDISKVAVEKAKNKGLSVGQFDFNSRNLPFTDKSFEVAVLLDVLEHLYQPQNILREAIRVAREIVLAVPNFNSLPARLQTFIGRVPENNLAKKGHIYWFNFRILQKMLKDNGFKIVEMRVNTIFSQRPLFKDIFKFLAKVFPNVFALSFVVRAWKPYEAYEL
jgi:methionine biosynthesis protein MetW